MKHWLVIVKNEIRIKTNRFRKNRKLFLIITFGLFLYWAFYLGPNILIILLSNIAEDLAQDYNYISAKFIQYFLTTFFLIILIYPLYNLYRKSEIGHSEVLLASPVNPKDIFLGEYVGKLIFYFLFILGIGPMITGLMYFIRSLNIIQYLLIYISLFLLMAFSFLVGTIIANFFEHRMIKSEKAKDLGKTFLFFLSMIIIGLFYILRFLFNFIKEDPRLEIWLLFYPSFWYSNIILYVIDPSLIFSNDLFIILNIFLGIFIPFTIFYFSYKNANSFYTLESKGEKEAFVYKKDLKFYKFIRKITFPHWKGLVILHFKQFFRKKENLFKIIYIGILISIMGLIIMFSFKDPSITKYNIINSKFLIITIISWMGGLLFGILIGIHIFMDSKQFLFHIKSTPRGIKAFVYSYIYEILILLILLDLILTIFFTFTFQLDILLSLIFFLLFLFYCMGIEIQAIGIQCYNPLFGEQGKDAYKISYWIIFLQIIAFIITLYIIIPFAPNQWNNSIGLLFILLINLFLSSGFAIIIFYIGLRKLNNIE
ncbi:MAG: hypothetical protein ACFFCE_13670 [Promethearchaeota archaeon]